MAESFTYDNLIVRADFTEAGTLEAGQNLTVGAVLGKVTATGKLKLNATEDAAGNAISDGSENPYAILIGDCDASAGDKSCSILKAGVVNENSLYVGLGQTVEATKEPMRDIGINYTKGVQ